MSTQQNNSGHVAVPVDTSTDTRGQSEYAPYKALYDKALDDIGGFMARIQELEAESDRLQEICAAAYQLAGAVDAPLIFLDVLANPLDATQEQIDSLLPVAQDSRHQ